MVDLYLLHNDRLVTDINDFVYSTALATDLGYIEDEDAIDHFFTQVV